MDLEDFSFFLWAPVLLIPLAAIYWILRFSNWESNGSLFLDAWLVWLAWFGSTILGYLAVVIFYSQVGMYWELTGRWWIAIWLTSVFVANILGISAVLSLKIKRRKNDIHLFEVETNSLTNRPSILQLSIITTMAAIVSLLIAAASASGIGSIYEYYNPAPKDKFEIYDI